MTPSAVMAPSGRASGAKVVEGASTLHVSLLEGFEHCSPHSTNATKVSFEESILTILPAAVFLVLAGGRCVYLFRSGDKAKREATYTPKLVC